MVDVGRHHVGADQDVGDVGGPLVLAPDVVLLRDRLHQLVVELPVLEHGLGDVRVPVVHDLVERGRIAEQRRETRRPRQDVEAADAVQQAREERLVGVALRVVLGEHVAERGDVGARAPELLERLLEPLETGARADLRHRERDRRAAHHVVAHARDRRPELGDRLAAAVERGGIGHLEQPRRQRGLRAHDAHDLIDRGVVVAECAAHADRDVGERRQLDLAGGQFRSERRNELEGQRVLGLRCGIRTATCRVHCRHHQVLSTASVPAPYLGTLSSKSTRPRLAPSSAVSCGGMALDG